MLFFQDRMDRLRQSLDMFYRLDYIVGRALLHGFDGDFLRASASDDYNWYMRRSRSDGIEHLQALETEDVEITQHEIIILSQQLELEFRTRCRFADSKPTVFSFQGISHQLAVEWIVVNIKNANWFAHAC